MPYRNCAILSIVTGLRRYLYAFVLAPTGTPNEIANRLSTETEIALQSVDIRAKFVAVGVNPVSTMLNQFAAMMKNEIEKWRTVISASGIKLE